MRDFQVVSGDALVAEQEYVDIDYSWTPSARGSAATLTLDLLDNLQQLPDITHPFDFDHLVQESRLVQVSPRLGFYDTALTQHPGAFLAQSPARGA